MYSSGAQPNVPVNPPPPAGTVSITTRSGRSRTASVRAIDERLEGIDDPAERVAFGVRLSARMARTHPEIMRILRHRGLGHIHSDRGLSPRALGDLKTGAASGRFTFPSPEIALSALGGSLLALLDPHLAQPDANGDEAAAAMAEMMLRMLGVPADEARDIADRPLPAHD